MYQHPEQWIPDSWRKIAGNAEIKTFLMQELNEIRFEGVEHGTNALITGPSRTGKSSAIRHFTAGFLCNNLNQLTLDACCDRECCRKDATAGRFGIHARFGANQNELITVNCAEATAAQLQEISHTIQYRGAPVVIWLDEIHRLAVRGLDEQLLVPMDIGGAMWIGSSTTLEGLEPALLNRFAIRLTTEPPKREELILWLAGRCMDCGVQVDNPSTLELVVDDTNLNPGLCLNALANAVALGRSVLTRELAERFVSRLFSRAG